MVGASVVSRVSWVVGSAITGEGGECGNSGSKTPCVQDFWVCKLATAGGRARVAGTSVAGGMRSQALLPLMPGSLWLGAGLWSGGWTHVCHLSFCYQVLWGCGHSCQVWGAGITGTAAAVPSICLLYAFQSTCLYMYRCVEHSGILLFWTEGPLLSYGYFTGYRWKGKEKVSI